MAMNSPSGGWIFSSLVLSKSWVLTQSWKLQSSKTTSELPLFFPIYRSSQSCSLRGGFPVKKLFIWMHPSIDWLITYPDVLNKTDIFSRTSTKISFLLFSLMDLLAAVDFMVLGLKKSFPNIGFGIVTEESVWILIGSLTIWGLIWSDEVNCGYPKSITSSKIS